jgi:alpha-glucosidase
VADQETDADSLLSFYKKMLHIRKENPALIWGDYQPLFEDNNECLVFLRTAPEQTCLVVLNMSEKPQSISSGSKIRVASVLFTHPSNEPDENKLEKIQIAPFGIFIGETK